MGWVAEVTSAWKEFRNSYESLDEGTRASIRDVWAIIRQFLAELIKLFVWPFLAITLLLRLFKWPLHLVIFLLTLYFCLVGFIWIPAIFVMSLTDLDTSEVSTYPPRSIWDHYTDPDGSENDWNVVSTFPTMWNSLGFDRQPIFRSDRSHEVLYACPMRRIPVIARKRIWESVEFTPTGESTVDQTFYLRINLIGNEEFRFFGAGEVVSTYSLATDARFQHPVFNAAGSANIIEGGSNDFVCLDVVKASQGAVREKCLNDPLIACDAYYWCAASFDIRNHELMLVSLQDKPLIGDKTEGGKGVVQSGLCYEVRSEQLTPAVDTRETP